MSGEKDTTTMEPTTNDQTIDQPSPPVAAAFVIPDEKPGLIVVNVIANDGGTKAYDFKTVRGAAKWARGLMGEPVTSPHAFVARSAAGTATFSGITFDALFTEPLAVPVPVKPKVATAIAAGVGVTAEGAIVDVDPSAPAGAVVPVLTTETAEALSDAVNIAAPDTARVARKRQAKGKKTFATEFLAAGPDGDGYLWVKKEAQALVMSRAQAEALAAANAFAFVELVG